MVAQYAIALHAFAVLADDDSGGESKKAGPIALLVIVLLAISCFFLFRSMSKHLKRVRDDFPGGDRAPTSSPPPPSAPKDPPADDAGTAHAKDAPT